MKRFGLTIVSMLGLTCPCLVFAQDRLEPIDPDMVHRIAKQLCDAAAKIDSPQVKVDPATDQASGVHHPHHVGAVIVPTKGLKEENENPAVKTETGSGFAYLFLHHIAPTVNGKPAEASQLRTVKVTDDQGKEHEVSALLLAVRQVSDDDWRLYVYGHDKKPLIDARFSESAGPGTEPVAVEVKEIQDRQGKLFVTVFNKYQASFPVAYQGE